MAIRQVITFRVKPGSEAAFAAGFAPIVEKVRRAEGCEQYELFAAVEASNLFVMLERWRDLGCLEGALKAHYKGPDDPATAFFKNVVGTPLRERYEV
jgi:quinol monooxygenase YgiN